MPPDESPMLAYLEAARSRMLALKAPGESSWRETVLQGLNEAYANADHLGLAQVVQLLASLLEADGKPDAAVREIDLALSASTGHRGAAAWLTAGKAALLASQGHAQAAAALVEAVTGDAWDLLEGTPRIKTLALVESVRMTTLCAPSSNLARVTEEAVAARKPLEQLFLLTWQIPYAAARGSATDARPLIRTASALAHGQQATFRRADIAAFERWLAIVTAGPGIGEPKETHFNPFAHFRMACLDVWQAVMQRNWAAADIGLEAVDRRMSRTGNNVGGIGCWQALVAAAARGEPPLGLEPTATSHLTLGNLGSAVAGAYAVALAGTKSQADEWFDWAGRLLRRGFESSFEAPVSLRRVQGLLAIRAGKATTAGKQLSGAARACAAGGFTTEAALADMQAHEVRTRLGLAVHGDAAESRARVGELGFDPMPHLYAVHNAFDTGAAKASAILTPREREVLKQLALGRTYKESADSLGVAWKTVQTQAHRIYEKLSVGNRTEAIAEARRLGLI